MTSCIVEYNATQKFASFTSNAHCVAKRQKVAIVSQVRHKEIFFAAVQFANHGVDRQDILASAC